ncbi:hypothetical protein GH741_17865 [Aquibacillus halophilus]|uniref:DUF1640 domain-containing protein n=1 Tax=Aquibacillus halophilus TaxID=930132 RepID=A0A6A8DFV7_9BACI|nr:hypothetical protein [Aquibacillus halophilus]MRH44514.1 hypothetical protein [Aquibacillus halophilus]
MIKDLYAKQKMIEDKLEDLESTADEIEEFLNTKTGSEEVKDIVEQLIKDKQLVTKADLDYYHEKMEVYVKNTQVMMIKWVIGTGLSSIAAITSLIRIFS